MDYKEFPTSPDPENKRQRFDSSEIKDDHTLLSVLNIEPPGVDSESGTQIMAEGELPSDIGEKVFSEDTNDDLDSTSGITSITDDEMIKGRLHLFCVRRRRAFIVIGVRSELKYPALFGCFLTLLTFFLWQAHPEQDCPAILDLLSSIVPLVAFSSFVFLLLSNPGIV